MVCKKYKSTLCVWRYASYVCIIDSMKYWCFYIVASVFLCLNTLQIESTSYLLMSLFVYIQYISNCCAYCRTFLHTYLFIISATMVCFSESSIFTTEDQELVQINLSLTNPLSTVNNTIKINTNDGTAIGKLTH